MTPQASAPCKLHLIESDVCATPSAEGVSRFVLIPLPVAALPIPSCPLPPCPRPIAAWSCPSLALPAAGQGAHACCCVNCCGPPEPRSQARGRGRRPAPFSATAVADNHALYAPSASLTVRAQSAGDVAMSSSRTDCSSLWAHCSSPRHLPPCDLADRSPRCTCAG